MKKQGRESKSGVRVAGEVPGDRLRGAFRAATPRIRWLRLLVSVLISEIAHRAVPLARHSEGQPDHVAGLHVPEVNRANVLQIVISALHP